MHSLRMLGAIGLTTPDGREVDALLRQPKHIALLAYLALPHPGSWHRRDEVIGIFWPDLDQARARTALRSAVYTLRRHLPDGAIRSRGDDDLSIAPEAMATDVAEMNAALAAGRYDDALARYQGDLLPALYVPQADGFDQWLEQQRGRARASALRAAALLSEQRAAAGDVAGALDAIRRAGELNPDDEAIARRWIALLDRAGDRSQALAVYERLSERLRNEFGTTPSAETAALIKEIRARVQARPSRSDALPDARAVEPTALNWLEAPEVAAPVVQLEPARERTGGRRALWTALAGFALIGAAIFVAVRHRATAGTISSRRLVVLPMENETGDPAQDYVASGIADDVARRLGELGPFTIRSGARSEWPEAVRHDYRTIARQFGSTVLLRTTLARVGDSLELRAAVVDAASSSERQLSTRSFSTSRLRDVESALAAEVAGVVFRAADPKAPGAPEQRVDPESYRLTLDGWHQLLTLRNTARAQELFQRATALDPGNARAWSGLSSTWSSLTTAGRLPFDVGYDRTSAAASRALALDSLQGSALANLGYVRALRYRSLAVGEELIRKGATVDPANPEIPLVESILFRLAHQWDRATDAIRVARALDPLSSLYTDREAFVELCAGRAEAALQLYRAEYVVNPTDSLIRRGLIRSLVRTGQYDEAITRWREEAVATGDTALSRALARAHGAADFWALRHEIGRRRLRKLRAAGTNGWVAPHVLLLASFEAGDFDAGYAAVDAVVRDPVGRAYHLPCLPALDEVRDSPRFAETVARIGALPLH